MILFQNGNPYKNYLKYFHLNVRKGELFNEIISEFLSDRFCSSHILEPIYKHNFSSFYTNANDLITQKIWAKKMGLPKSSKLSDILKFQIEESRCDVFYNLDPITYNNNFISKLPSNVKRKIAWCGVPCNYSLFNHYDFVVCNFPSILEDMSAHGLRCNYFSPSYDSNIQNLNTSAERKIDLIFTGSITRNHTNRLSIIYEILPLCNYFNISINLEISNFIKIANTIFVNNFFPSKYKLGYQLEKNLMPPLYGLELYKILSNSKIVINCSIDMPGKSRGNIRCFEALNCGALLYADEGIYPEGFVSGNNFLQFKKFSINEVKRVIENYDSLKHISIAGNNMLKEKFSKSKQWLDFMRFV